MTCNGVSMINSDSAYPRFWESFQKHGENPAVVDYRSRTTITYRQLEHLTRRGATQLQGFDKQLACLPMTNDVDAMLCYLSLLRSGHAIYLCGPQADIALDGKFTASYRPGLILWKRQKRPASIGLNDYQDMGELFGYCIARCSKIEAGESIYPELALLLSTSGSTASSKTVRLSYRNIAANAWQIAQTLNIDQTERAVLSLPLQYAYGLSVLHSFLSVGACLVIGGRTVMESSFWDMCRAVQATTLPAVPTMLRFMQSIGVEDMTLPSLRKITVAGAAMDTPTRNWMVSQIAPKQIQIYSMYGMTEATARIAVLPADAFANCPASVGLALPHGVLELLPSGEIVYRGPNVMLGYANARADLARADKLGGVLNTGDLGSLDAAGHLYITGRLNRFCKLLGARINLTDVEDQLAHLGEVAAVSDDESIRVFHTNADESQVNQSANQLADQWRIPRAALMFKRVQSIPRTESGKVRYPELWKL